MKLIEIYLYLYLFKIVFYELNTSKFFLSKELVMAPSKLASSEQKMDKNIILGVGQQKGVQFNTFYCREGLSSTEII